VYKKDIKRKLRRKVPAFWKRVIGTVISKYTYLEYGVDSSSRIVAGDNFVI
jgi:hypothetical protein